MKKVLLSLLMIGSIFVAMGSSGILYLNIMDYDAKADGTDDALAFTKAMNDASATGNPIYIPNGVYGISRVKLKSNVSFIGESVSHTVIKSLDPGADYSGTFCNNFYECGELKNISFKNISFDGRRWQELDGREQHSIIFLKLENSESIENLKIEECVFSNVKNRALHILHGTTEGDIKQSRNIQIVRSSFYGGDDQIIGDDTTNSDYPGSAVRIEFYYEKPYGSYFISDITIDNCYAEKIRTLADIKRGCQNFVISNCVTKNIHDCHHSIDGSKFGLIKNCTGEMDADFIPQTGTNFIEIQGEDITVSNITIDGNMKLMRGIQIQDHFTETNESTPGGNKLGHISNNITVSDCIIKNVLNIGIKFTNAHNSVIKNCIIENSKDQSIAVESGNGNTDINGVKLTSNSVILCDNKAVNCGKGFTVQGENNILLGGNFSRDNITFFDNGDYRLFRRTFYSFYTGQKWTELNPNPGLILNSEGTRIRNWETGHEVVTYDIVDKPEGTTGSVILTDDTPWAIGEVELDTKIECTASEVLHLRVFAKKADQNTKFSIVFAEFDGDTYLGAKYMFSHELSDTWNEFYCNFIPENSATNQIKIKICPASVEYNKSDVGKVKMASLNISKTPIGMK